MNVTPITPADIENNPSDQVPNKVIEIFNSLIKRNYDLGRSKVFLNEIMEELISEKCSREYIYRKRWLNVEELYRKNGWKVQFHKPYLDDASTYYFLFEKI